MKSLMVLAVLALAACGIDGPPERPTEPATKVGVSGHAVVGVSAKL